MNFLNFIWFLFFLSFLLPMMRQQFLEFTRRRLIRKIEEKRKSRVITLIHRQEMLSFLGLAFSRFIDIEDSEQILRAIRMTPDDMPIDLILHTPGGLILASEQIAHALVRHKAKVTVFIPHYAMSGGTLVALAADEIVMDEDAVLGPVDPQVGKYPAASILEVTKIKDINETDDETLILADMARKARSQVKRTIVEILVKNNMPEEKAEGIAEALSCGRWTHDYPIGLEEAKELGIPVKSELPKEVYDLMSLYPQAGGRRPSVQYIPVPYRRE
jgi:ClpP class serine protease